MVVIRFELWPEGDESKKRELSTMAIANVGGDAENGDYEYGISHQNTAGNKASGKAYERNPHKLLKWLDTDGKKTASVPWKHGIVLGFPRRLGVVKLAWYCLVKSFGERRFGL